MFLKNVFLNFSFLHFEKVFYFDFFETLNRVRQQFQEFTSTSEKWGGGRGNKRKSKIEEIEKGGGACSIQGDKIGENFCPLGYFLGAQAIFFWGDK